MTCVYRFTRRTNGTSARSTGSKAEADILKWMEPLGDGVESYAAAMATAPHRAAATPTCWSRSSRSCR
jgi:hypothetical protein